MRQEYETGGLLKWKPERQFSIYHDCLECDDPSESPVVSTYILMKLAARCNLACTYCYWFRDKTVMESSKILTLSAEDAFVVRLEEHLLRHQLRSFFILFHGGEPLLFGRSRFDSLCAKLRRLEVRCGVDLRLALTTNGVLIDAGWTELFSRWRVGVTISLDGPRAINDGRRVGLRGEGSFEKVIRGLVALRRGGIAPGFLSVCDPSADAAEQIRFFVEDLGAHSFDILIPDATNDDSPASIADFYIALFDAWWDHWLDRGVSVRLLETFVIGLLGEESRIESIGFGPNTTCTLTTDGMIEPLDVLRTVGHGFTRTRIDIFRHGLQEIQRDPLWREVLAASLT